MTFDLATPLPPLRPVDITRHRHDGDEYFVLRDRLQLAGPGQVLVPAGLGPLLAALDGSRDARAVSVHLTLRYGLALSPDDVSRFAGQLSAACLLDDERAAAGHAAALATYHAQPFRPPALADGVYPADPAALTAALRAYGAGLPAAAGPARDGITGLICPHIDYGRGGPVYARLWQQAEAAARAAEVVVIFGTDHQGAPDRVTLTRLDYATPWGPLPTDGPAYAALADALGADAFAEELHHRTEHSIELAAVWLHHARGGEPAPVVPVLCGHPGPLMAAGAVGTETAAGRAVAALRSALAGRRVLAIAAADLAHVGPAFHDPAPFGPRERAAVRTADEELIAACAAGAGAVLRTVGRLDDRYRICGLAPIALMLELIGPSEPETLAYDQCPADAEGGSFVSIAGVLLRGERALRAGSGEWAVGSRG